MTQKHIVQLIKSNKLIVAIFSALFFLILVVSYLRVHASVLDSDKVVDFLLMKEILTGNFLRIWYPPDSFVHRIPYVYFFYSVFGSTTKALLFSSLIDYILMYSIFGISYFYILKKLDIQKFWIFVTTFISFLIFSSFCAYLSNQMANPFGRGIEIAISFLIFLLLLNNYSKPPENIKIIFAKSFFAVVALGIVLFSDPFLTFTFYLPLAAFCFIRFLLSRDNGCFIRYFFIIFFAVITSYIIRYFLGFFGIVVYSENPSFTTVEGIFLHNTYFIKDLLFMFNADFTSLKIGTIHTMLILTNLAVLAASIFGLVVLFIKKTKSFMDVNLFLLILLTVNILAFIASDKAIDGNLTVRYLVLLPFILLFGLAKALDVVANNFKLKYLLLFVILISTLYSSYLLVKRYTSTNIYTNSQSKIVNSLKENNLTYGYSGFWEAGLTTFLSGDSIKTRQIICLDGQITPFYFATAEDWYQKETFQGKTFIIRDDSDIYTEPCSEDLLLNQFGEYESKVRLDTKTIYIWNYNIGGKFDTSKKHNPNNPLEL